MHYSATQLTKGHDACLKLLLEAGANIEAKSNIGFTALLSSALKDGHDPVVKVLLEAGANTEAKNKVREGWGAVLAVAREVAVVGWW